MSSDLQAVRSLRRVLESTAEGKGVARSAVDELRSVSKEGQEVARLLLLGLPLEASLRPLSESKSEEVGMLASLVLAAPSSSAAIVGRSGRDLSDIMEGWTKARESRRLEQKVMRFRSLVTSAVLGGVTAMVASLGPVIGNLDFTGSLQPADTGGLIAAAACMSAMSSAVLGYYMSGKKFVVNVAVTLGVFALVASIAGPLAAVPSAALWGVK